MQDETITSVAARVSGSGCAKLRKTGRKPPPGPAQTGAKAAGRRAIVRFTLVLRTRFSTPTRRASERVGLGLAASLARRAGVVAVAAEPGADAALTALAAGLLGCADEGASGLPNHPENRVGRLSQVWNDTITSVAARVSGSGCAKLATGAQAAPGPAKTGANAPAAVTDRAPGWEEEVVGCSLSVVRDQLVARVHRHHAGCWLIATTGGSG